MGVDGQTGEDYEEHLEENLQLLLDRFKSGRYKAPPVRRTYVPKGDGKQERPIGIPTFEDKVLQRAVSMVLEAVYEQDFRPCSYGYRPGRSAHMALEDLWQGLMEMRGGWVLELDITSFFDHESPPASGDSRPEGARWGAASDDRQVACRRRSGGDRS